MTTKFPATIGEVLSEVNSRRRQIAVYEELVSHLTPMLSTDSHEPTKGIKSPLEPDTGIDEDTIADVQKALSDKIGALQKEIDVLMGAAVQAKALPAKKGAPKRSAPKRQARSGVKNG
jgi:hypothetical protein